MDILAGRTAYISGGIISTINHCLVENSTINGYVTKGDANELPDDYIVSSSNIVGQYVALIPILGNVLTLLSSSMGFLLIIVLSLLAFFIYQLYKLIVLLIKLKNKLLWRLPEPLLLPRKQKKSGYQQF